MDNEVIISIGQVSGAGFVRFKWSVGDSEMVGIDVLFSFKFKRGHGVPLRDYAADSGSVTSHKILVVNIWLALPGIIRRKA